MSATKRCGRCKRVLPLPEFNFRDKARKHLQSYCRECSNAAWRAWYAVPENKAHHLRLLKARRQRRYSRNKAIVRALKSRPCAVCGESYSPEVMDFDHLENKEAIVSSLVYTVSTLRLLTEIVKCEIVCANCHRLRTAARLAGRLEQHARQQ